IALMTSACLKTCRALALWATGQILTVAAQVGFISLGGIAARNGLLLISTYLDEVGKKGFVPDAVVAGSLERMSPVLMTALTTGIGLVPLVWGGPLPGREFLLPIATVILGGLVTSTLCEFLVRPGLFYIFSEEAAESLARKKKSAFTVHVDAA
ncbi:MAG: efflux RND transporter permease subunit, partial [Planctomycetota bacterium]